MGGCCLGPCGCVQMNEMEWARYVPKRPLHIQARGCCGCLHMELLHTTSGVWSTMRV